MEVEREVSAEAFLRFIIEQRGTLFRMEVMKIIPVSLNYLVQVLIENVRKAFFKLSWPGGDRGWKWYPRDLGSCKRDWKGVSSAVVECNFEDNSSKS